MGKRLWASWQEGHEGCPLRLREAVVGPPPSAWTQMDTVSAPSFPQSGPDRQGRFSLGFLLSSAEEHPSRPGGFTSSSAGGPCSLQLTLPSLPPAPRASLPPWPALALCCQLLRHMPQPIHAPAGPEQQCVPKTGGLRTFPG